MGAAVRTPFRIVRYLMEFERVTVTQVAEDLGLGRQNARKWLKDAVAEGVAVEMEPITVYRARTPTYGFNRGAA